jgi:SAM-dependent methyltransferase
MPDLRTLALRVLSERQRRWLRGSTRLPTALARRGARRRLVPLSRNWGSERGHIIDRYYIERFLDHQRHDIRGAVLEIGESVYTRSFGDERVTSSDVLDPDPAHGEATVVADLTHAPQLESARWDCIICTNVLGLIYDLDAAIATLGRILRPGGTLLVTLPACTALCRPDHDLWGDFWRFTPTSARALFARVFAPEELAVQGHGNVLAAAAFLQGLAQEDLSRAELDHHDPAFPLAVSVRARRPPVEAHA